MAAVPRPLNLSLAQARRIAIAAQGLATPRPKAVTARQVHRVIDHLAVLQIDTVATVDRAHYLPLYSRLGPYDRAVLDRATGRRPHRLVETWAHEASFLRADLYPLFGWRRTHPERFAWGRMVRAATEHPDIVEAVRGALTDHGPLTARQAQTQFEAEHPKPTGGGMWSEWSVGKAALEWLFFTGEVTAAGRTAGFERIYDLAERVVGPGWAETPLSEDRQLESLVEIAASVYGLATAGSLADYFRLPQTPARDAIGRLVKQGRLVPAKVTGQPQPYFLHPAAARPRSVAARTLLSPFDQMVFHRARLEALFGLHYRLEYYLPVKQRVYGYYVMPFLLGEQMVARVDVKADRAAGRLLVPAAWLEAGQDAADVAPHLAAELESLAAWQGLGQVSLGAGGTPALARCLAAAL
ncbi:MAG: winged helix DNA-binding domain-containing protein [Bifidobacteriaceae bacterium]|jgi:uncharacterized protein YcaQ|nr:winged helix DNA-binding domain-containing protein [Bifidobacteriaceae bacterium]